MKSAAVGLLWRICIGLGIAIVGIVVSFITHRWNIEYWWFGGFGVVMMMLAALPFMGGASSSAKVAFMKPDAFTGEYKESRSALGGSLNWVITTFVIGIINLLASILVYHFHH